LFDVGSGVGEPIGGGLLSIWNPVNGRLYSGNASLRQRWPLTDSPDTAVTWLQNPTFVKSWSGDGLTLLAEATGEDTSIDLWHVQLGGDGVPDTLMATPFVEGEARISPDGNWFAYESDFSGQPEAYITTYPDLTNRLRISQGGGSTPLWAHDGSEIYYRSGDRVMVVRVSLGSPPSASPPEVLFRGDYDQSQLNNWDVDAQGRFVMVRPAPGTFGQFQLVTNLAAELAGGR
jgi:Tol biopolymer transport system component